MQIMRGGRQKMMVKKKPLSASELLDCMDKQWADWEDVAKIGCVGIDQAKKIKKDMMIKWQEEHPNKLLPYGLIPMKYVVDYFDINISYLKKLANKQKAGGEMREKINTFVFYRSFYDTIKKLPKEAQLKLYETICEYALNGKKPKKLSSGLLTIFEVMKPSIDVSKQRYINACKRGE